MKKMQVLLLILVLGAAVLAGAYLFRQSAEKTAVSGRIEPGIQPADPPVISPETPGEDGEVAALRVMTYNIRHGRGNDGRVDLERIAGVIRDSGVEVVGLNEVDRRKSRSGFQDQVKYLAEELQMSYAFGPTIRMGISSYGNALLSKYPLTAVQNHLLPEKPGMERRGLLEARIAAPGQEGLAVMTTHLSLDREERELQLKWLDEYLKKQDIPFLLMGDFNSYTRGDFSYLPAASGLKSFPSINPTEEIDLFFTPGFQLSRAYTIESQASDHLPVVVELLPG